MVEPVSATTLLLAKTVVPAVSEYISQRYKEGAQARARQEQIAAEAQAHREQLASEAVSHSKRIEHERWLAQFESEQQAQRDDLEADRRRREELDRRKLDHYPVEQGPGFLRSSLQLGRDDDDDDRLVVLLAPTDSEDASGAAGAGLRVRVEDDLQTHVGSRIRIRRINRPLQWPNHDLYVCDLYDVSALILQISLANGRLMVRLGGCNLGLQRAQDPQSVFRMNWPTADDWSSDDIERLNATGFARTRFPVTLPLRDEQLSALNHELASRIITLCVVTAMDAVYLTSRVGYNEALDNALIAAGAAGDDWPVGLSIDDSLLVDLPYHYLHRVARRLARKDVTGARNDLRYALAALCGGSAGRTDIVALLQEAIDEDRLVDHHRAKATAVIAAFPPSRWQRAATALLKAPRADRAPAIAESAVVQKTVAPRPPPAAAPTPRSAVLARMLTPQQIAERANEAPLSRRFDHVKREPT